jgi:large subunit ribosomal protein L35
MPKIKTHSGLSKRVKFTKNGKIKRAHANKTHILNKKTTKRKRSLRKGTYCDVTNMAAVKRLVPYK